jgi:hypothetical protein
MGPSLLMLVRCGLVLLMVLLLEPVGSGAGPRFYEDDPISVVPDTQDASRIRPWEINLAAEMTMSLFMSPGDPTPDVKAMNVNTVDEVPDSSWFTNRLGRRPISVEEMRRGPDTTTGPAAGAWTVVASKNNGVTPGFTIRDTAGQVWFLKFEARGYRGMATGTEVAVTKLLWALGYFVPENYIASLDPARLAIGDQAKITTAGGTSRPMRQDDIQTMLGRVDRERDGSYRVIASRALPKVGEFLFHGTHPEDPNDVVPHEHRRELRGYGVFAAWLNHVDAKGKNTLDALISEKGRGFVRHYLQDFGSALGSASVAPREHWEGSEFVVEPRRVWREMLGFGFVIPAWRTAPFYEAPAIGRLLKDNSSFDPEAWRPRVPNAAFTRARLDDKFWAARRLMFMTDDLLRAAIDTGRFDAPDAEAFLVRALAERRDAIVRTYMTGINPVVDPALSPTGDLTFANAAMDAGVAPAPARYRVSWAAFDNATGAATALAESAPGAPPLAAPVALPTRPGSHVRVAISAEHETHAAWSRPVYAYFRRLPTGAWKWVGFERLPVPEPVPTS